MALQQKEQQDSTASPLSEPTAPVQEEKVEETGPVFIAFARVFSGTLRKGQELYVLGPKYDPSTMKVDNVDPNLTLKVIMSVACFSSIVFVFKRFRT